jgi:hypothetical protein
MSKVLFLFLLIAPSLISAKSSNNYGHALVSEVISIYDADTFRVSVSDWPLSLAIIFRLE